MAMWKGLRHTHTHTNTHIQRQKTYTEAKSAHRGKLNSPIKQPLPILAVASTSVLPTYSGPLPSTLLLWMRKLSRWEVQACVCVSVCACVYVALMDAQAVEVQACVCMCVHKCMCVCV